MKKINKTRRGFSLVELMVVVAIMGTLAAIAIPAYNEYRKSAKKTAYKSDMLSFHKGMLAFGVELDSFCERETQPDNVSISHIGMTSLSTSKLYGGQGSCADPNPVVTLCAPCAGQTSQTTCGALMNTALTPISCGCIWSNATSGPGKHNFIGFSGPTAANGCSATDVTNTQIIGGVGGTTTTPDGACDLGIVSYDLGVYGHISGDDYYGVSVDNNGVVSPEHEAATAAAGDSNC